MPLVLESNTTQNPIDRLAAPAASGDVLIWPALDQWPQRLRDNYQLRRSYDFQLCHRPFKDWASLGEQPVIASGHQPELFHPGVWIKNALVTMLAEKLAAQAKMLVVDADVPATFSVSYPTENAGKLGIESHRLAGTTAAQPFECLEDIESTAYGAMFDALSHASTGGENLIEAFRAAFLRSDYSNYVDKWLKGIAAIDTSFGLATPECHRISHVFGLQSDRFSAAAAFTVEILRNAAAFRAAYNAALARYRDQRGIHGTHHPIPDLIDVDGRIELPFWLLNRCQVRRRLLVGTGAGRLQLFAEDEAVGEIALSELTESPRSQLRACLGVWEIRPRAIAQTMYFRLFECDLFVHGIGGAKYDQITDALISKFWQIEPPTYACASATLRLALPVVDGAFDQLRDAIKRRRDLRFNPQRFLTDEQQAELSTQLQRRQAAIDRSRFLAEYDRKNRAERKKTFDEIRHANAELMQHLGSLRDALNNDITEFNEAVRQNNIAGQREWFVGLYSRAALDQLIQPLRMALEALGVDSNTQ